MGIITNVTEGVIKKAAKALKDGHLVAFPTETVYGLGADATNEKAVNRIYSVKGRPADHPLIVHISSIKQLDKWAIDIPEYAIKLASKFWPGPMTLILKRNELAKDFITGGQENVGLRIPSHPVALELLKTFKKIGGNGISAPSANIFGAVSPTTTDAVVDGIGKFLHKADFILNGGQCDIGVESTIIDCTKDIPVILRPGAVTLEMISRLISKKINIFNDSNIRAAGLFNSHYAPMAKVILNDIANPGDGYIAMAQYTTPKGCIRLSSPLDVMEFARDFYEALRLADKIGLKKIIVVEPAGNGLALAIRDRIKKAAAENKISFNH